MIKNNVKKIIIKIKQRTAGKQTPRERENPT